MLKHLHFILMVFAIFLIHIVQQIFEILDNFRI